MTTNNDDVDIRERLVGALQVKFPNYKHKGQARHGRNAILSSSCGALTLDGDGSDTKHGLGFGPYFHAYVAMPGRATPSPTLAVIGVPAVPFGACCAVGRGEPRFLALFI